MTDTIGIMKQAFSLVELSIVLVILGLLTGGILAGQSLIRASELRAVSSEAQRYVTAAQTFRDKYFTIPGDFRSATKFWGTMTNCGVASPSGTGTQTCDGDGDGYVTFNSVAARTSEPYAFWQHLANAGLIEGTYTGIAGAASGNDYDFGTNTPGSKLSNSGWGAGSRSVMVTGSGTNFDGLWRNWLYIGSDDNGGANNAVFAPEEAWNIDTKMDDGKPGQGKVISKWVNCTNAADGSVLTADYLLTTTSKVCDLRFINTF